MAQEESMTDDDTVATRRAVQIFVGDKSGNRAVRVSHSGGMTPRDISKISDVLVNDVIKGLTGCACLSGVIDVIWERNFDRVLNVQLGN